MPLTKDATDFSQLLSMSGLMRAEELQNLIARFPDRTSSAEELAATLIERGLLTPWQLKKLLKRKYHGFFLGPYKLQSHLAKGGMSTLYSAVHVESDKPCALKLLPPAKARQHSYLPRFLREARLASELRHENILRVFEVGQIRQGKSDLNFMAMELLSGRDLYREVSVKGPSPVTQAAEIIRQAAEGLHHIHQHGLVHRDVKPGNVFLTDDGTVKIIDLGLAAISEDVDENLTQEFNEQVLGTADYLAPEQAVDSHDADHRADIYGLGCTFYFLLTGRPPFADGSLAQRILAHQSKSPQDVRELRDDVPDLLLTLLDEMLVKERGERVQTAELVARRLKQWLAETGNGALPCKSESTSNFALRQQARKLKRLLPGNRKSATDTPTDSIRASETHSAGSVSEFTRSEKSTVAGSESDAGVTTDFELFIEAIAETLSFDAVNQHLRIEQTAIPETSVRADPDNSDTANNV